MKGECVSVTKSRVGGYYAPVTPKGAAARCHHMNKHQTYLSTATTTSLTMKSSLPMPFTAGMVAMMTFFQITLPMITMVSKIPVLGAAAFQLPPYFSAVPRSLFPVISPLKQAALAPRVDMSVKLSFQDGGDDDNVKNGASNVSKRRRRKRKTVIEQAIVTATTDDATTRNLWPNKCSPKKK